MSLPVSVDLRPAFEARSLLPRSQGNRGTCSLFALATLIEFESAKPGAPHPPRLSIEYLNWASHRTNCRKTDGSFFSDALNGLHEYGICREALMPYADTYHAEAEPSPDAQKEASARRAFTAHWIKPWDVHTGLSPAQIDACRQSLADGHPVAVGLRWPKKSHYEPHSLLVKPPPADVFDGHSIVLAGYTDDATQDGGGVFLFRNHSGPDWQEHGYARFSYGYALAYANDAVTVSVGG